MVSSLLLEEKAYAFSYVNSWIKPSQGNCQRGHLNYWVIFRTSQKHFLIGWKRIQVKG